MVDLLLVIVVNMLLLNVLMFAVDVCKGVVEVWYMLYLLIAGMAMVVPMDIVDPDVGVVEAI